MRPKRQAKHLKIARSAKQVKHDSDTNSSNRTITTQNKSVISGNAHQGNSQFLNPGLQCVYMSLACLLFSHKHSLIGWSSPSLIKGSFGTQLSGKTDAIYIIK